MLTLVWRASALDDLDATLDYIAARDPAAADRLHAAINRCADTLSSFPYKHRFGRASGTREAVVHPNYILVYRTTGASVEIVSLVHARRKYP